MLGPRSHTGSQSQAGIARAGQAQPISEAGGPTPEFTVTAFGQALTLPGPYPAPTNTWWVLIPCALLLSAFFDHTSTLGVWLMLLVPASGLALASARAAPWVMRAVLWTQPIVFVVFALNTNVMGYRLEVALALSVPAVAAIALFIQRPERLPLLLAHVMAPLAVHSWKAITTIEAGELLATAATQVFLYSLVRWVVDGLRARDLNAAAQARQTILEQERLEHSLTHQAHLLSMISHQFREPIAHIEMQSRALLWDGVCDRALAIQTKSLDMLNLLNDLAAYHRGDTSYFQQADVQLCHLNDVLDGVIQSCEIAAARHSCLVRRKEHDDIRQLWLRSDPTLIGRVTLELVRNALLHSNASTVVIDTQVISTGLSEVRVKVTVTDDGIGIPTTLRDRVFEPFCKSENSSRGLGLGLHLARLRALGLGGDLRLRPNPPNGTIAILEFSCTRVAQPEVLDTPRKGSSEGADNLHVLPLLGRRILVVDDSPPMRELARKVLRRLGAEVELAGGGIEALAMVRERDYDLLLTDIMMPDMDGYALVEAVRLGVFDGPIVALSAAMMGEEAARMRQLGADGVLSKPLKVDALEDQLRHTDLWRSEAN